MNKITKNRRTRANYQYLQGLIDLMTDLPDNQTMVEIGSYSGEGTEIWAMKCSKVFAIDPWANHYDKNDSSSEAIDMKTIIKPEFDERIKKRNNVEVIQCTSHDAVSLFMPESIDIVYIDGLHTYEGVKQDIIDWMPIIKLGGYLCGHDYDPNFGVIQAVDEIFGKPDKLYIDTSWLIQKINKNI